MRLIFKVYSEISVEVFERKKKKRKIIKQDFASEPEFSFINQTNFFMLMRNKTFKSSSFSQQIPSDMDSFSCLFKSKYSAKGS